jgi:hypothetical protein
MAKGAARFNYKVKPWTLPMFTVRSVEAVASDADLTV